MQCPNWQLLYGCRLFNHNTHLWTTSSIIICPSVVCRSVWASSSSSSCCCCCCFCRHPIQITRVDDMMSNCSGISAITRCCQGAIIGPQREVYNNCSSQTLLVVRGTEYMCVRCIQCTSCDNSTETALQSHAEHMIAIRTDIINK